MSESLSVSSCILLKIRATMIVGWLLATTSAMSAGTILVDEGQTSGDRSVAVSYELPAEAPEGTLLGCLRDHSLTLSNFRWAAGNVESALSVNPADGSIVVVRPHLLNAETQPELRLSIVADEELAVQDEFLAQFSAGLLEEGLSSSAIRALSTGRVSIEVIVRLREVPKCPELADSHFLVEVRDEAAIEIGTVSIADHSPSEHLCYSIVSGNEDDHFRIDSATGSLSFAGSTVHQFGMFTAHELGVQVENAAGLSSMASVSVTVINETPQVSSIVDPVHVQSSEHNSGAATAVALPVRVWVGELPFELPFGLVKASRHTAALAPAEQEALESVATVDQILSPPASEVNSSPQGVLLSVVVLIAFVLTCVATAVVWSRAATARRAAVQEEATRPTASAIKLPVKDDEHAAVSKQAGAESSTTAHDPQHHEAILKFGQLSAQVTELQQQVVNRDQTIEKLTTKLLNVCRAFDQSQMADVEPDSQSDAESWNRQESPTSRVEQQKFGNSDSRQAGPVAEPMTDARVGLTAAREEIGRQMQQHSQSPESIAEQLIGESDPAAVAVLDDSDLLRSEFSDLFDIHRNVAADAPAFEQMQRTAEPLESVDPGTDEDSHLDSVKNYLSTLLSRSKSSDSADAILANRRNGEDQRRQSDRRTPEEPTRKPVVSFLDSYMQSHGGELAGIGESDPVSVKAEKPTVPAAPEKHRTPVDVRSIRESMNSFRAVAIQSVENAVLTHDLRQAKGQVVIRTALIGVLMIVAAFVVVANMVQAIQFSLLSWLMAAAVLLAIAELGLRMQRQRKHRKTMVSAPAQENLPKRRGRIVLTEEADGDDD